MLPIESECVQRAIFWGVRGMRDQGRELTGPVELGPVELGPVELGPVELGPV
jgi:hypothetical protein